MTYSDIYNMVLSNGFKEQDEVVNDITGNIAELFSKRDENGFREALVDEDGSAFIVMWSNHKATAYQFVGTTEDEFDCGPEEGKFLAVATIDEIGNVSYAI